MRIVLATLITDFDNDISKIEDVEVIGTIKDSIDTEYDLKQLIKEEPDAIILNRYLFEDSINAVKLIKELREIRPNQRFIILTGKYEAEFIQPLVNIGVYDFLINSFELHEVKELLLNPNSEFNFIDEELRSRQKKDSKEEKKINIKLPLTPKVVIKSVFKEVITFLEIGDHKHHISFMYAKYLKDKNFKVLFLDYDFLNPKSEKYQSSKSNIYDLLENFEETSKLESIERFTKTDEGVTILSAPFNFYNYHHLKNYLLEKFLLEIKKSYDYVVVSINPYIADAATNTAMKLSDSFYISSKADSISNLETINTYTELISERICKVEGVIVTNYTANSLTSIEIEAELKRKALAFIDQKYIQQSNSIAKKLYKGKLKKEFKKLGR